MAHKYLAETWSDVGIARPTWLSLFAAAALHLGGCAEPPTEDSIRIRRVTDAATEANEDAGTSDGGPIDSFPCEPFCVDAGVGDSGAAVSYDDLLVEPIEVASEPVVALVPKTMLEFEGGSVTGYVPDAPEGVVFVFHGPQNGANFVSRPEPLDVVNHFVSMNLAVYGPASLDRTNRIWNTTSDSLTENTDLARIAHLYDELVESAVLRVDAPIFLLGYDQGAEFASLAAEVFYVNGLPVRAVALYLGHVSSWVPEGPNVSTFFLTAENDLSVEDADIEPIVLAQRKRGVTSYWFSAQESALQPAYFMRIDGVTSEIASDAFEVLVAAGLYDEFGNRLVEWEEVDLGFANLPPGSYDMFKPPIRDQIGAYAAQHFFNAQHADATASFFAAEITK